MASKTQLTYLFDPLCGWCYGACPMLEGLFARQDFAVELLATGLFAGAGARPMDDGFAAFAWSNDQRIARLSGQTFSEAYHRNVLGDHTRFFDSGPATLALTAVALSTPEREFEALKAIQNARYVESRDITNIAVLAQVLRALNLSESADRLVNHDDGLLAAYRARLETALVEMSRFGVSSVPTLIVGTGDKCCTMQANDLYGSLETLVEKLKAA